MTKPIEKEYAANLNALLLLKLDQSFKNGFKANKTLCDYLGVDFNNIQARTDLFSKRQIIIKDRLYPSFKIRVSIKHNEQTWDISMLWAGRVGRSAEGRRRDKCFATYPQYTWEQIKKKYEEIRYDNDNGDDWFEKVLDRSAKAMSFRKAWPKFILHRKALCDRGELDEKTYVGDVGRYHNHLSKVTLFDRRLMDWSIGNIKRSHIIQLKETLMKTKVYDKKKKRNYSRGASVVNGCIANLKSFFEYAEDHGLVLENTNPVYRIEKEYVKPREMVVPHEELARFMKFLLKEYTRSSERVRIAIYLLWLTGQRADEILQIRWEDIIVDELNKQRVLLIRNKKSKRKNDKRGDRTWPVYLTDEMISLFNTIPRIINNPFVFWTDRDRINGKQTISSSLLNNCIKNVCAEIGMKVFSPHDIKRSIVSHDYYKLGVEAVKLTTGNKSDKVLQTHYVHSIKGDYVEPNLYEKLQETSNDRNEEIQELMQLPTSNTKDNVLDFIPKKKHQVGLNPSVTNQRRLKFKQKIQKKHGVSLTTYYRKKKEGYYK